MIFLGQPNFIVYDRKYDSAKNRIIPTKIAKFDKDGRFRTTNHKIIRFLKNRYPTEKPVVAEIAPTELLPFEPDEEVVTEVITEVDKPKRTRGIPRKKVVK
jgi:hypothetical protein